MRVKEIIIYPVKSLGGISLKTADAEILGFQHDRRMMLIDQQGNFITQRQFPLLSTLKCYLEKNKLIVESKSRQLDLHLSKDLSDNYSNATIWDDKVITNECLPHINQWFSDLLNTEVKLVSYSRSTKRTKYFQIEPGSSEVSFADGYPYLLLGTASMDKLNNKLEEVLQIDRFRANLIIETGQPPEEDHWSNISIGSAIFKNIKPCKRCIMTTIDQSTGTKGPEPLKTLSTYRTFDNHIHFGTNLICIKNGIVAVGDEITLQ
jgi:uncharacterized protein YcbX